jgi:glycosyltransferase involved in cell wall biosynthesis
MRTRRGSGHRARILMLVENVPLARDHRLRKQAATLIANGFAVTVICRRDPRNKDCVPGVRVLQYPAPREGTSLFAFAFEYGYSVAMAGMLTLWALVRRGFDIMQIASTPDIYFLVAAPCRMLGRPVIFDFRDPSPETFEARYGKREGAMYRALLLLERLSLRAADRVLVVNDSLRAMAHERATVDDAIIVLVGNGPTSARIARRQGRPDLRLDYPYLACWLGLIGPQDRVDLALHAVAYLVRDLGRTDCGFVFVGSGEELPAVRQLAADLGIERWVHFAGWAEEDLVFDYLSTADIGIEPNTEDYVSGVKVMEYLATGLPIVAFRTTETERLAGDAARYAPKPDTAALAKEISLLLDDQAARDEMSLIGQNRVREFIAWDHQAERYIAAINGLLKDAEDVGRGQD